MHGIASGITSHDSNFGSCSNHSDLLRTGGGPYGGGPRAIGPPPLGPPHGPNGGGP